jgi:T-complex protein 1 subunit eta
VAGVAFKITFSYAGFEMQPKQYTDPKIALLNIELELKAERDNAEVRLENVEVINILAIMTLIKMFNDTSLS